MQKIENHEYRKSYHKNASLMIFITIKKCYKKKIEHVFATSIRRKKNVSKLMKLTIIRIVFDETHQKTNFDIQKIVIVQKLNRIVRK